MSEEKFTQGEWHCKGFPSISVKGNGFICKVLERYMDRTERVANANLIAAAPEMYRMLSGMYETSCITGEDGEEVDEIKELLAKARGE